MNAGSQEAWTMSGSRRGLAAGWTIWLALTQLATGCLVDSGKLCGGNQVYMEDRTTCVCAPGTVQVDHTCAPCGPNEEVVAAACACKTGFTRDHNDTCVEAQAGLGFACVPGSMPCADPTFNHCIDDGQGGGYCSKQGCTSHADCGNGYTCTTWEATPVCKRPPSGLGNACMTDAECAGKEANTCEAFMLKTCVVGGCTVSPDTCHAGAECCDFSALGGAAICLPSGTCPF